MMMMMMMMMVMTIRFSRCPGNVYIRLPQVGVLNFLLTISCRILTSRTTKYIEVKLRTLLEFIQNHRRKSVYVYKKNIFLVRK